MLYRKHRAPIPACLRLHLWMLPALCIVGAGLKKLGRSLQQGKLVHLCADWSAAPCNRFTSHRN